MRGAGRWTGRAVVAVSMVVLMAGALQAKGGNRVERDLAYGPHPRQRFDAYLPAHPDGRLVVMVHGGGWRRGDKAMARVVDNKAAHWLARGATFVSVDYRLLPEADPAVQARDIATAVARVQQLARGWRADPARLVLVGHSAGGHLVALLAADPSAWRATGLQRWQSTVVLDAGALDVPALMARRHASLFDDTFGRDPAFWRTVSPRHRLSVRATPMLLVCSAQRERASCDPARGFAHAAAAVGVPATVLPQPLSHREINETLGVPGAYTHAVDAFIARFDPGAR